MVKDAVVCYRTEKFDVFGMGPDEGLGGAGGAAEVHARGGDIGVVPDLLGHHAADGAEALERGDVVADVHSSGQLVVGALSCEDGPGATLSPVVVVAAVFALAVAVVIVAAPAVTEWGFDLEGMVDDFEGVDDEGVVGAADAVADEFEEARVDDLAGLEVILLVGGAVGDVNAARSDLIVVKGFAYGRGLMRM